MQLVKAAFGGLATGLIVALALNCAAAAVLGHGGRFSLKLDVLTHFAPFWLAGGVFALACAMFLPGGAPRSWAFWLSLVAVIAAGAQVAPEYLRPMSPRAPADAPHQIKIIQFNAWGYTDAKVDTTWLTAQDPDIIVMQEATPSVIASILATRQYYVSYDQDSVPILSKRPPLTTHLARPPHWWPWAPTSRASFPAPGGAFDVISVHYTWPTTSTQTEQGYNFARTLRQFPQKRLIVAGDFNSTPWSFSRRREDRAFGLERRTRALFSWPAASVGPLPFKPPIPFLAIDHVYAGSDWRTVRVERGPAIGSDHYPVVIVLALAEGD